MNRTTCLITYWSLLSLLLTSCSGLLLPSIETTSKSPWQSFEEAKIAFDKVIPNQTTREDLKKLSFDPFETPNVSLITYLELTQKFIPNQSIRLEDLDPNVQDCLKTKEACQGYQVSPQMLHSKRYGNLLLDLFNFRRQKLSSGWKFDALIVLKDDLVVYKLWGGEPNISETEDKKNPLGPFQDIGNVLPPIKF